MVATGSLSRMSMRDSGDCAAMRGTREGERSQAAPVAAVPRKRLLLVVWFEIFMIYRAFIENSLYGRQSCLRTRFLARPDAGWKAGGSHDWLSHGAICSLSATRRGNRAGKCGRGWVPGRPR